MKLRFLLSLLPVILGSIISVSALFAQPEMLPEAEKGVLAGVIVTDTGDPLWGSIPIYVTYPDEDTITVTANADGAFSEEVPAGTVNVSIPGDEEVHKVVITAQRRTDLNLTIARKGIVVAVNAPDGAPTRVDTVTGITMMGENEPQVYESYQLDEAHWWFPDAGNCDNFTLHAGTMLFEGNGTIVQTAEWTFEQPERFRAVSMTIARRMPVELTVVDDGGTPIGETEMKLSVSFDGFRYMPSPWESSNKRRITVHPAGLSTDADGVLALGELPAGKYQLSMRTGTQAGPLVDLELKPDGTLNIRQYALNLPPARTVRQTVFDAYGRAVPNSTVSASYAWLGKMTVVREKSDTRGVVTWHDIPPVPVIVWGAHVPPCLLPQDMVTVNEPLPVPFGEEDEQYQLILTLTNPPEPQAETSIFVMMGVENGYGGPQWASPLDQQVEWEGEDAEWDVEPIDENELAEEGEQEEEVEQVEEFEPVEEAEQPVDTDNKYFVTAMPGSPFSLMAAAATPVPKTTLLNSLFLPIADSSETIEFPLTLADGALIHVKLVSRDGKPVPRVGSLKLMPLTPDQSFFNDEIRSYGGADNSAFDFYRLRPAKDGQFETRVPLPGTYRLLIDLYDETTPPLPGAVLEVKPGEQTFTVTLPEPLMSLPAGAEVSWLSRNAPADTQRLIVPALAPRVPLYGPRNDLIALWYRPTPDRLALYRFPAGTEQIFMLRSTEVTLPEDIMLSSDSFLTIQSLLPVSWAEQHAMMSYRETYRTVTGFEPPETDLSDRAETPLQENGQTVDLWTGQYTLSGEMISGRLDVPEQGVPTVTMEPMPENFEEYQWRSINVEFPQANYDEAGERLPYNIGFTTDAPDNNVSDSTYRPMNDDLVRDLMVSSKAHSFTLRWLGYGVIRNVPIPEAAPPPEDEDNWVEEPAIQLPEWEPGLTVSGTVITPDGLPAAETELSITINNDYEQMLTVQTDKEGHFTVNGLLPGPMFITYQNSNPNRYMRAGCWTLEVPEAGLANLVLRVNDFPMFFQREYSEEYTETWWLPDGEKASRIPGGNNSESGCYDQTRGSGWLWSSGNTQGRARCYRVQADALVMTAKKEVRGPVLGITLPLAPEAGQPGAVTITGLGERAGFECRFTEFAWQSCAALGLIVGQIDAVPPGRYSVKIETDRGVTERPVTVTEYGCNLAAEWPGERE